MNSWASLCADVLQLVHIGWLWDMQSLPEKNTIVVGIVAFSTHLPILSRTILSLLRSSVKVTVVVLCNSQLDTYQMAVRQLCKQLGVICMSNEPNRGFGAGHNKIFQTYPCEWYICCNPDVEVLESSVESLLSAASSLDQAVLLGPKVLNFDGTIQPLSRKHLDIKTWIHRQLWRLFPQFFRPYEILFNYAITQPQEFVSGCFFLVSSTNFLRLGGFDEGFFLYAEDADLSFRASKIGVNYYVAESVIYHVWTTDFRKNGRLLMYEIGALIRLFSKHYISSEAGK